MISSLENASKKGQQPTRVVGIFKDYFIGLDSLRNYLEKKEEELNNILTSFYKVNQSNRNSDKYKEYLLSVNSSFNTCNNLISTNNANNHIFIHAQADIAKLINVLKGFSINLDTNILDMIVDFWENIKYSLELSQILLDSFERDVYSKLNVMYSYNQVKDVNSNDHQLKVFMTDITTFSKCLPDKIINCRLLIKSCGTHLREALLDQSLFSNEILAGVDIAKYPLLRIMPDLEFKFNDMFRICKKWLDREETFILNINVGIRQNKLLAKEKEMRITSARDHQKNVIKSFKTSFILSQNSKIKMKTITQELKTLENQIRIATSEYQQIGEEKYKTQSMAEFLSISISQTRKNYSLQMKKQRLEMQVTELETTLIQLDTEISMLKHEMMFKSQEKTKTQDKFQVEEKRFLDAKVNLEAYSQNLTSYKKELASIRQTLNAMEGLQLLKSCPEYVENIFGDVSKNEKENVQLAPSLLNSISKKTQKNKQYYVRELS